jgi:hypothetical protein
MPKFVCDAPDASEQVEYYTLVGLPGDPQVCPFRLYRTRTTVTTYWIIYIILLILGR